MIEHSMYSDSHFTIPEKERFPSFYLPLPDHNINETNNDDISKDKTFVETGQRYTHNSPIKTRST